MHYTVGVASNTRMVGTTSTIATYSLDWSFLKEDTGYHLSFSFISDKLNLNQYNDIAVLTIDLGQYNSFRTDYFSPAGTPTQFLGGLVPYLTGGTGASCFLYADNKTNTPIYLRKKPIGNQFTVGIYSLNTGLPWTDFTGTPVGTYGLSLIFTEDDKIYRDIGHTRS